MEFSSPESSRPVLVTCGLLLKWIQLGNPEHCVDKMRGGQWLPHSSLWLCTMLYYWEGSAGRKPGRTEL